MRDPAPELRCNRHHDRNAGRAGDIRRLCAASDDPWTRCHVRAYSVLG